MDDLFSILEPKPVPPAAPAEPVRKVSESPKKGAASVLEPELDGIRYRIERHQDKPSDGGWTYWKLFIRDSNKWRQLHIITDAKVIPDKLLQLAEGMLEWAAGASRRRAELVAKLQPGHKPEPADEPF